MATWIRSLNNSNLNGLDRASLLGLCAHMRVETHKKGHAVFRHGDESTALYIILSGSVGIFIPRVQKDGDEFDEVSARGTPEPPSMDDEELVQQQLDPKRRHRGSRRLSPSPPGSPSSMSDHSDNSDGRSRGRSPRRPRRRRRSEVESVNEDMLRHALSDPDGVKVAELHATSGHAVFGELGLLEGKVRSATVKTLERSLFLVVGKQEFDSVLAVKFDISQKVELLREMPIFRNLEEEHLSRLAIFLEQHTFSPHRRILRQGDKCPTIFFISHGECVISQAPENAAVGQLRSVQLASLGPGEMFGDVAALLNVPAEQTITSLTTVDVYAMDARELSKRIPKVLLTELTDLASTRRAWRSAAARKFFNSEASALYAQLTARGRRSREHHSPPRRQRSRKRASPPKKRLSRFQRMFVKENPPVAPSARERIAKELEQFTITGTALADSRTRRRLANMLGNDKQRPRDVHRMLTKRVPRLDLSSLRRADRVLSRASTQRRYKPAPPPGPRPRQRTTLASLYVPRTART